MMSMDGEDETAKRVDENLEKGTQSKYDLTYLASLFNKRVSPLDIYCIEFAISTEHDKNRFTPSKDTGGQPLYTASFFCKKHDEWFIYRVILPFAGPVTTANSRAIREYLSSKAKAKYLIVKRFKDPLWQLRNIYMPGAF